MINLVGLLMSIGTCKQNRLLHGNRAKQDGLGYCRADAAIE
jgi:hypothetical protein